MRSDSRRRWAAIVVTSHGTEERDECEADDDLEHAEALRDSRLVDDQ